MEKTKFKKQYKKAHRKCIKEIDGAIQEFTKKLIEILPTEEDDNSINN